MNQEIVSPSYNVALFPYVGIITDGVEDWIKAYNNSTKVKIKAPVFSTEEQNFYETLRGSIKLLEGGFKDANNRLKDEYEKSDKYFSSLCKPIAKLLRLYDIYGVYFMNDICCDNTILDGYYNRLFAYGGDSKKIKNLSEISGKYIAIFEAFTPYKVDTKFTTKTGDYGGLIKSPFGHKYSHNFFLFSMLCQINFILIGINAFIKEEIPTKLRFSYILYYYLLKVIPDVNKELGVTLHMNNTYYSDKFRNAMAHYKLGVALQESEIIDNDIMFGLTQKYFGVDYMAVKQDIITELKSLSKQIKKHLDI